ncbi:MAG TPA: hypothetical protein VIG76_03260 [Amnibacterium sp.]|jgi:hypothetical protein|uniref:hypothetical protein n=1 Tax=Amnibacterium sp. TaxID=1872496 RepID=UPI002F92441A
MPDDPSMPGMPLFGVFFAIVLTLVVAVFVLVLGTAIYRGVRLRRQGVNPLTLDSDLAVKVMQSDVLRRTPSKAERLAELDVLAANGTISAAERATARERILEA